jgi:hypothetical protein
MKPVYNSKGEQVSGFIRPAIRPKKPFGPDKYNPLPTDGDGILAIVNRCMNQPDPPRMKQPYHPVYVHKHKEYTKNIKETEVLNPVNVRLVVSGNGVKVKLDTISWNIHTEYFAKGKKPPLGPYLRSLAKSGASDAQLEKVVKSYAKWDDPKFIGEIDDMIQRIWPGNSTSKTKTTQTRKVLKAVKKI